MSAAILDWPIKMLMRPAERRRKVAIHEAARRIAEISALHREADADAHRDLVLRFAECEIELAVKGASR